MLIKHIAPSENERHLEPVLSDERLEEPLEPRLFK